MAAGGAAGGGGQVGVRNEAPARCGLIRGVRAAS
jgi:hypothetical protein